MIRRPPISSRFGKYMLVLSSVPLRTICPSVEKI
jgi:hypothetical protein